MSSINYQKYYYWVNDSLYSPIMILLMSWEEVLHLMKLKLLGNCLKNGKDLKFTLNHFKDLAEMNFMALHVKEWPLSRTNTYLQIKSKVHIFNIKIPTLNVQKVLAKYMTNVKNVDVFNVKIPAVNVKQVQ